MIGIIGAENSHTAAIAKILNVDKSVEGFQVGYVWGETDEVAKAAAEKGSILNIVSDPKEMLGKIDAVICDHRHPKYHLDSVLPFVKEGIPTFVDKPFCYRSVKGKEFLHIAQEAGAAVTSFSVLPMQTSARNFFEKARGLGQLRCGAFYGPSDLASPYGGVFFYGIHQLDLALWTFGYDVKEVLLTQAGADATGQLLYGDGRIVTLNLRKEWNQGFHGSVCGSEGVYHQAFTMDENRYLTGVKTFCTMFETGEIPFSEEQILRPVQVLEALEASVMSGKRERVAQ